MTFNWLNYLKLTFVLDFLVLHFHFSLLWLPLFKNSLCCSSLSTLHIFNSYNFFLLNCHLKSVATTIFKGDMQCLKGIRLLPELFPSSLSYCLSSFLKSIIFHLNKIAWPILSCFALFDTSKYYLFGQVIANFFWGCCLLSFSSPITYDNFWEKNQQT